MFNLPHRLPPQLRIVADNPPALVEAARGFHAELDAYKLPSELRSDNIQPADMDRLARELNAWNCAESYEPEAISRGVGDAVRSFVLSPQFIIGGWAGAMLGILSVAAVATAALASREGWSTALAFWGL